LEVNNKALNPIFSGEERGECILSPCVNDLFLIICLCQTWQVTTTADYLAIYYSRPVTIPPSTSGTEPLAKDYVPFSFLGQPRPLRFYSLGKMVARENPGV